MKKFFKKSKIISEIVVMVLIVGFLVQWIQVVWAAPLTNMSDTMTRLKVGETADHTLRWTLPTGVQFNAGDKARVVFPAAFETSASGWAIGDFTFNDGTARTIDSVAIGADPTCNPGANNVGIRINSATDEFIIIACPSYTASNSGAAVTFEIKGTSPNGTLTNPSSAASYKVDLVGDDKGNGWGADDDTGSFAVAIITDEQVVVSATVDPSITFSLSANSVNLGTLSSTAVAYQSITIQTATNALGGYSTTVLENHNLRINVANDIDDVTDGAITAGSEEYGLATSDSGQQIAQDTNCPASPYNASAITSSAQTVAGATSGPVDETVTLCFAASITGTTTAGAYSHTLTFISTATF